MHQARFSRCSFKRGCSFAVGIFLLLLGSCSFSEKTYRIAIDPYWFPVNLYNKEAYVLAFAEDLLKKIAERSKIDISVRMANWDSLLEGLQKKEYEGVLCSLQPYVFNLETYDFSDRFLSIGSVLVVKTEETFYENNKFQDKILAVFSRQDEQIVSEEYPEASVKAYDNVMNGMLDLIEGRIDGLFLNYLQALNYVEDLYQGSIKIASGCIDDQGFKLVTLSKQQTKLIQIFNAELKELKKNGEYDKLLRKWRLL